MEIRSTSMIDASWDQLEEEIGHVREALAYLEVAIPERTLGTIRTPYAIRIAGIVDVVHASIDKIEEWVAEARKAR